MKSGGLGTWISWAFVLLFFFRRTHFSDILFPSKKGLNINMPTASDVITGLETLTNGALGASESAATKMRIHAVSSVLGSLGDEFAPLLESKFDIAALFGAITRIENGAIEAEGGVKDLITALNHKSTTEDHSV